TFEQCSDGQKIADLYQPYVDTENRKQLDFEPLNPSLTKIDAIEHLHELYRHLVEVEPEGVNPFFGAHVYAHMNNRAITAVYLGGGSLGLGRSYYQKVDEKNTETLGQYANFISTLYSKVDQRSRDLKGPKIVAFEKEIASYLKTIEESRDAQKRYNPVAVTDLGKMVKNMDIAQYIADIGFKADTVIIGEINYYQNLDKILTPEKLPTIKEYLKFNVMNEASGYLSSDLD